MKEARVVWVSGVRYHPEHHSPVHVGHMRPREVRGEQLAAKSRGQHLIRWPSSHSVGTKRCARAPSAAVIKSRCATARNRCSPELNTPVLLVRTVKGRTTGKRSGNKTVGQRKPANLSIGYIQSRATERRDASQYPAHSKADAANKKCR